MSRHDTALPISVIIPVRDRAALLRETLASIEAQTARPAEVIVVDDGSTDESPEVARAAGATVLRTPGYGVSVARNLGIDRATSPWVAFCDSDDLWEPQKLEAQWAALEAAPRAGFCFTDLSKFGDDAPSDTLASSAAYRLLHKAPLGPQGAFALEDTALVGALCEDNFAPTSSWLMRRHLAQATGFDPNMRFVEDHDFLLRLMSRSSAVVVERPLLRYRVHGVTASRNAVEMALASLSLIDRATARPDRYPQGTAAYLRRNAWALHRRAAMAYVRTGKMGEARAHLRSSLRRRIDLRTVLALAALSVSPNRVAMRVARSR